MSPTGFKHGATVLVISSLTAQGVERFGFVKIHSVFESCRPDLCIEVVSKAVNASEEFLGQRDDDARRASHVAESVHVLVLGHLADEFGAVGAQASDSG